MSLIWPYSAVHYTHATATFSASLLLRLARLFPDQCVIEEVRAQIEKLAGLLSGIPGKRYAVTLQLMLKRARKRSRVSQSRSPTLSRENRHHRTNSMEFASDPNGTSGNVPSDQQGQGVPPSQEPVSPYDFNNHAAMAAQMHMVQDQHGNVTLDRFREGRRPPRLPVNGVLGVRSKVRTHSVA